MERKLSRYSALKPCSTINRPQGHSCISIKTPPLGSSVTNLAHATTTPHRTNLMLFYVIKSRRSGRRQNYLARLLSVQLLRHPSQVRLSPSRETATTP